MRITKTALHALRLEMVNPLKTARGTYGAREGFVVRLEDEEGRVGQGEAMPLEEFGTESPSGLRKGPERRKSFSGYHPSLDPLSLWERVGVRVFPPEYPRRDTE